MGVATVSVLITHASDTIILCSLPYIFQIMSKIATLIGSQTYMFFFLSRMGSWFSYEKNKDAVVYCKNRAKRTVVQYLLLASVAYAILDLWLLWLDVLLGDLTCVSFYIKHVGARHVILIYYMVYQLLHALLKIDQKAPMMVARRIIISYFLLTCNTPFSGNKAYSLESYWGERAAGCIAFLIG